MSRKKKAKTPADTHATRRHSGAASHKPHIPLTRQGCDEVKSEQIEAGAPELEDAAPRGCSRDAQYEACRSTTAARGSFTQCEKGVKSIDHRGQAGRVIKSLQPRARLKAKNLTRYTSIVQE